MAIWKKEISTALIGLTRLVRAFENSQIVTTGILSININNIE
jgi:hypothetical protein